MAEDSHPSRYVKLTRDQDAPTEDIRPGELNQPVHVPQLEGRKCSECGQVLPETYEPPADEPWTTGIFGCTDDPESCGAHDKCTISVFLIARHGGDCFWLDAAQAMYATIQEQVEILSKSNASNKEAMSEEAAKEILGFSFLKARDG